MLLLIIAAVLVFIAYAYYKLKKPFQYWKERGVPHVEPRFLFGNTGPIVFRTKAMAQLLDEVYTQFSDKRYFGFYSFSRPSLVIKDLELIKRICIKDFDKFADHTDFIPGSSDTLWKKGLFAREGKDWHDMRSVLTPAFTGSKMKAMFYLMVECAEEVVKHFQNQPSGVIAVDMRDTVTRFTNDVIASCAFGIKCDSINQRDNEFFLMGKEAFDFSGFKQLKFFGASISPKLMKLLKISFFDEKVKNFFRTAVRDTIQHREETGLVRPDMIHLLLQAQKGLLRHEEESSVGDHSFAAAQDHKMGKPTGGKNEITQEDITAQAVIFLFGGYDTVANLLSNIAYALAVNPDVQEKLIQEVDDTFNNCNGKITYEALLKMKYLDMVVSEALRLWPVLFLNRKAVKPYTIEPMLPGEKPLHIEVGTEFLIPIFSIHRDPKHFRNPDKFDPERFSDANKKDIDPITFLSFGTGPRSCIGNRFALLETKLLIFYLLSRFEIVPVEKTGIPFVLSREDVNPKNEKGYWLGLKPRS